MRYVSDGKCVRCGAEKGALLWATQRAEQQRKHSEWAEKNPGRVRELFANWRKANAAKDRADSLRWQHENRSRIRAAIAKRKAALLQRMPAWADPEEIQAIYAKAALMGHGFEVDHIIPLQGVNVSGLHVGCNLQIIPTQQNRAKGNRFAG